MMNAKMEQVGLWLPRQTAIALRVLAALREERIGQVVDALVVDAAHAAGVLVNAVPPTPAPMPETSPEIVPMTR